MNKSIRLIPIVVILSFYFTSQAYCQYSYEPFAQSTRNFTSSINSKTLFSNNPLSFAPIRYNLPTTLQDTLSYQIITNDGNEFIGTIIEQDPQKIVLKTASLGIITIQKSNIKSMTLIASEKIKDGAYWEDHMQSTRHFWSPNGYGLKKGEAYYQNVWIFFNQFSVGITDNILLGGGIIPAFLIAGTPTPVWITPKVSFPVVKDKVNVGVGGLFATVLGESNSNIGITYGTATFGPRDKNVTVGIGYGYADGSWASSPTFSLAFISRVGKRGYFISENYLISTSDTYLFLGMIGGRSILGKGNVGLDYGLVVPISSDIDTFVAIPWLGITVPLSQAK